MRDTSRTGSDFNLVIWAHWYEGECQSTYLTPNHQSCQLGDLPACIGIGGSIAGEAYWQLIAFAEPADHRDFGTLAEAHDSLAESELTFARGTGHFRSALARRPATTKPLQFKPGDHLALRTDVLLEARNKDGELYGFERLQRLFAANPTALEAAEEAVRFGQDDDVTVVTLAYTRGARYSS